MAQHSKFRQSIHFSLAFFIALFLGRIFEMALANHLHIEPSSYSIALLKIIWYDSPAALLAGCFMFLSTYLKKRPGEYLMYTYTTIYMLIHFGISIYYFETNSLLGSDLWAYSMDELFKISSSSASIDMKQYVPIALIPLLVFVLALKYLPKPNYKPAVLIAIILLNGSVLSFTALIPVKTEEKLVYNRTIYLLKDSFGRPSPKGQSNFAMSVNEMNTYRHATSEITDVLGDYIPKGDTLPDIYVVLLEGLGTSQINEGDFGGFTPFIDSISKVSLYWPNTLSATGRSFGALPSLLASLPAVGNGFLDLGPYYPKHVSLPQILKRNGYLLSCYYGGDFDFDKEEMFLTYQGFDRFFHLPTLPNRLERIPENDHGFTWGIYDDALFTFHSQSENFGNQPRFEFIKTLNLHKPFSTPKSMESDINEGLAKLNLSASQKKIFEDFPEVFKTQFYVDQSLKDWFQSMEERHKLDNAIVIITGDHRVVPLPIDHNFDRFHVPLIVYSKHMKSGKTFKSFQAHTDVYPSIVAYLDKQFNINRPDTIFAMSEGLEASDSIYDKQVALMLHKGSTSQYLDGSYYLNDQNLYSMNANFNPTLVRDKILKSEIQQKLVRKVKELNYLVKEDLLGPSNEWRLDKYLHLYEFTNDELTLINEMGCPDMGADSLFFFARSLAFEGDYELSRLAAKFLLNEKPKYVDAMILIGRTYAWGQEYDMAEEFITSAISANPYYYDSYLALSDLYKWSDHKLKAIDILKEGMEKIPENTELLAKLESLNP